jgi:hypothetical protein
MEDEAGFLSSLLSDFSIPDGWQEWFDGLLADHLREYDLAHDDTPEDYGDYD